MASLSEVFLFGFSGVHRSTQSGSVMSVSRDSTAPNQPDTVLGKTFDGGASNALPENCPRAGVVVTICRLFEAAHATPHPARAVSTARLWLAQHLIWLACIELFDSAPHVRDTSVSARTNRSSRGVQRDDLRRTGTSYGRTGSALLNSAAKPHGRSALELGSNEFSCGATRTSLARCNSSPDSGRTLVTPRGTDIFRDGDAELLSMVSNDGLGDVRETQRRQIDAEKSSSDGAETAETSPESEEEEGEHDDDDDVDRREARRVKEAAGVIAGGVGKFGASEGEAQGNGEAPTSRGKRPACDGSCDASANAHCIKVIRVEPCRRGKGSLPELMKKLKTSRKEIAPSPPPPPKEPQPSVCACQEPGWLLRQWRDVRIPPLRTIMNSAPRKGVRVANRLSDIMVPDYDQLLALMPENIFDCMSPQNNASSNVTGGESEDLLDFSDSGDGWPSIDDGLQQQPSHA